MRQVNILYSILSLLSMGLLKLYDTVILNKHIILLISWLWTNFLLEQEVDGTGHDFVLFEISFSWLSNTISHNCAKWTVLSGQFRSWTYFWVEQIVFFEFLNPFSVGFSTVYETTVLNKKTQFWSFLLGPIFGEVGNWVDYLKMFAFKTLN